MIAKEIRRGVLLTGALMAPVFILMYLVSTLDLQNIIHLTSTLDAVVSTTFLILLVFSYVIPIVYLISKKLVGSGRLRNRRIDYSFFTV